MNLDFTITEYYDYEVDYQTGIMPSEYRVELNGEILFPMRSTDIQRELS